MRIENKRTVVFLVVALLLLLIGIFKLNQTSPLFADERWHEQACPHQNNAGWTVEYSNNCSPLTHPSAIWFVMFQGAMAAITINLLISLRPIIEHRSLREIFTEQIEDIRKLTLEDMRVLQPMIPCVSFVFTIYLLIQFIQYDSCMNSVYHMYDDWGHYFDQPTTEGCRASRTGPVFESLFSILGVRPGMVHEVTKRNGLLLKITMSSLAMVGLVATYTGRPWR